jgi:hypothetical protein
MIIIKNQQVRVHPSTMAPPLLRAPPSPIPTVFQTPQQRTTTAAEDAPPVAEVAAASLRLAFHKPSGSTCTHQSSLASSTTETKAFDGESAAASIAVASPIDDSSLRLPSYLLRLAGQNDHGVNLTNVFKEAAELGDGGDRDSEGNNAHMTMVWL